MRRGRPLAPIELSPAEKETLEKWCRCRADVPAMAERARIILACSKGKSNKRVAVDLAVTPQTVGKWRGRFHQHRLLGLAGSTRFEHGADLLDDEMSQVEALIQRGLSDGSGAPWSSRTLARALELSQSKVSRIIRGLALLPGHRSVAGLCKNGLADMTVTGIAGVLLDPPDHVFALAAVPRGRPDASPVPVDHGSGVRAKGPQESGFVLVSEIARHASLVPSRRAAHDPPRLQGFLDRITGSASAGGHVHLIADHAGIIHQPSVRRRIVRFEGWSVHRVPAGVPWLRVLQRWIDCLEPEESTSTEEPATAFREAAREYLGNGVGGSVPFIWIRGERPGWTPDARAPERMAGRIVGRTTERTVEA